MDVLPPPPPELAPDEARALGNLVLFQYGLVVLNAAGLCFVFAHWWLFSSGVELLGRIHATPAATEMVELFGLFQLLYVLIAAPYVLSLIGNFLSARRVALRTGHGFVLGVAVLNLLHMPFGTAAGIYTILTLNRPNVRAVFAFGSSGAG